MITLMLKDDHDWELGRHGGEWEEQPMGGGDKESTLECDDSEIAAGRGCLWVISDARPYPE